MDADTGSGEQIIPGGLGGFVELLGLEVDEAGPSRVTGHLDAGPRHHQPVGLVHGGVHASVAETLASIGAFHAAPDGTVMVGVSNTTDFFRPHTTGRLDAVAEPLHVGRTQHVWQVLIRRGDDGRLVARGQVRLQAVSRGDLPEGGA